MPIIPTLQTQRLVLRPFNLSDALDVQRLAGDRAIADTTLNVPHPYEDGMAAQWISTHKDKFDSDEAIVFAITDRTTKGLIGCVDLTIVRGFGHAAIGYWIGKKHWGNGFCTEACKAVLEYGFEESSLNWIFAGHFKRNPASGRVMQKIGMKQEGIARQHVKKWDIFEDIVYYGLLKEEENQV
jgi:[ribosomal protein S5]-alanine N-acetyltransferase